MLDDIATMMVANWYIATDTISSKLIYFVKGGDGGGGDIVALHGDRGPSGEKGLKGDSGDRGSAGSRGTAGKRGVAGSEGPSGKISKMGPVGARGGAGARGEKGDKVDTGGVGQQGPISPQGSTGPRGSQGATGTIGPKGDRGDQAVEIDIVAELCKHLPLEMVEQYHRGAYAHYAINSIEDIELHDTAHVKTIIDKGGRCNAMLREWLVFHTRVNSNYVLNFHHFLFIYFFYLGTYYSQQLYRLQQTEYINY